MPFRRKPLKQLEDIGQPIEKSLSSPNISEFSQNPGGSYLDPSGSVTVQRKKSWLSRLLRPFRKSKSRTLTEPTEQSIEPSTSSCFPIQKSNSQFYTSPYSPVERAPSEKKNVKAKMESSASEDCESSEEKEEVPAIKLSKAMQSSLLAELELSLKDREQSNDSKSPEPTCDNPKPIKKKSLKTKSRPLSADSGLISGELRNLEQIMENHYDVPDRGIFNEEDINSNKIQKIKPQKKFNNTEDQNFIKNKSFTYIEPQPIEPLHKFPKPRPPVNRRPSTRKGSRTAEELAIPNPRRSEAELEDIIRKINEIPPPDVEPSTPNLSEIEISSASIPPIPKKRTILPSSPKFKPQEKSHTDLIMDNTIDINYAEPPSTDQSLLESMHLNQKIIKPELPPKIRKPVSGSNTLPKSISSPSESISVYDIVKAFKEKSIPQEDLDNKPMKRVRTLPVRFHGSKNIDKDASKVFTSLLNSHQSQKQKTKTFKRTYSLHSKDILPNNFVAPDESSINKLYNKENEGEEANSPGEVVPEIRKDTYRQNKTISISRESYMAEFQNTMDNYLQEIHMYEVNLNYKTPPNTPEQFEEPTELQDDALDEINKYEISGNEPIESTSVSTEYNKIEPPNPLEIKLKEGVEESNDSFNTCIITNDFYESLSPLSFEDTGRFLQDERSSIDRDTTAPKDTYDSTKFTFGIIESSENWKKHLPDITYKTETTNKSQIQETIKNLGKTNYTFQKPYVPSKPDVLVRKGAIRLKHNSSSDDLLSNHSNQTHNDISKTEKTSTSSEQVKISTKGLPKLNLNSEPINQEELETKRQRSKSLY